MKRESRKSPGEGLKPVRKIELSEKHMPLKIALFVLFLALGITAIILGVYFALRVEKGWAKIDVGAASEINCSSDFTFNYNLGQGEESATSESKSLSNLYTEHAIKAYRIFDADKSYEGFGNVYSVNAHVNEEVEVDEALYKAFGIIEQNGGREIYLAPVYAQYANLLYSTNDYEAAASAPDSEFLAELAAYANDPQAVNIELKPDNKVKLNVSEEYLAYADAHYIFTFIDFNWMKNAFIIDYFADVFTAKGYTRGYFTSYDGFTRNLCEGDTQFGYNIVGYDGTARIVASTSYTGTRTAVTLRNFKLYSRDYGWYYKFSDGKTVSPFIDIADGQNKTSVSTLACYKNGGSCAELLLKLIPVYIAEELDVDELNNLKDDEIYSVYIENGKYEINYNQPDLTLSGIFDNGTIKYTEVTF